MNANHTHARHTHDLSPFQHSHHFDRGNREGEARTRWVLVVTIVTMAAEIVGGWMTGSMALLADGWHMGTHALALGVAAAAYALARRHARDTRFSFGTWKIEVLGSFASALVLGLVAVGIVFESAMRLWKAEPIAIETALMVAVIGLVVNLLSAWLLHGADGGHGHSHGHSHEHSHGHAHGHDHADGHEHADDHHAHDERANHRYGSHPSDASPPASKSNDLNLRAAYVHVLADALTSVLAIGALCAALWLGWWWLDPLVGVLGAVVIGVWSIGLMRESSAILLDREMDHPLAHRIREDLESDGDAKVADLHIWRVGRDQFAAIACVVADMPLAPAIYRERLARHEQLVHLSLEVNRCPRV
jgi:cation diffusion facilitator family transporter